MSTKKWGIAGFSALGLVAVGLRVNRAVNHANKQHSQSVSFSQLQSVREVVSKAESNAGVSSSTMNVQALQSIVQNTSKQNATIPKFDKYTPIDGKFSLGQIGDRFFVMDVKTYTLSPLDNVSQAFVLSLDNKDSNDVRAVIVGKIDNKWYAYGPEATLLNDLGDISITDKTRKVTIRNGQATAE